MKLLSFLQSQGLSRRTITAMIDQGVVFVNGEKVEAYKLEVNDGDEVRWGNKQGETQKCVLSKGYPPLTPPGNKEGDTQISSFLVFYKPAGYVCSKADPHNKTIYELLPAEYKNRYYIGRLDKESRGLVLMTNDPKLVNQYEHPRHGITKEYLVQLNKLFKQEDMQRCLDGLESDGEVLKCVSVKTEVGYVIRMVLNEGKKRHIRRMMSVLRYHVEDLKRVREGDFELGDLREGEWRIAKQW